MGRTPGFSQRPTPVSRCGDRGRDISDTVKEAPSYGRDTRVDRVQGGRVSSLEPRLDVQRLSGREELDMTVPATKETSSSPESELAALPGSARRLASVCTSLSRVPSPSPRHACGCERGIRISVCISLSGLCPGGHLLLSFPRALCQVVLPRG